MPFERQWRIVNRRLRGYGLTRLLRNSAQEIPRIVLFGCELIVPAMERVRLHSGDPDLSSRTRRSAQAPAACLFACALAWIYDFTVACNALKSHGMITSLRIRGSGQTPTCRPKWPPLGLIHASLGVSPLLRSRYSSAIGTWVSRTPAMTSMGA